MSKNPNQTATNHRFVISMPRLDKDAEKHIDLIQNQGFGREAVLELWEKNMLLHMPFTVGM